MKRRVLLLIATVPFWYIVVVNGHRTVNQLGPFADASQCEALRTQLTVPPEKGVPNAFYLPNSAMTECFSDATPTPTP